MARRGHRVVGTDVSASQIQAAVERCREEFGEGVDARGGAISGKDAARTSSDV